MLPPTKVTSPPPKETLPPSKAGFLPSKVASPPSKVATRPSKVASPPSKVVSPPSKVVSPPSNVVSPPRNEASPPRAAASPPTRGLATPPRREIVSPPNQETASPPKTEIFPSKRENTSSPKEIMSPPVSALKFNRSNSKGEENPAPLKIVKKDSVFTKGTVLKSEKLSLITNENLNTAGDENSVDIECNKADADASDKSPKGEESNGVGDKIKKFEKAAEDAGGRVARAGSVRRGRHDEPPPAATTTTGAPARDHVHFDLGPDTPPPSHTDRTAPIVQRQQSVTKNNSPNPVLAKWQRSDSLEVDKIKPEPQKIIKPEFKPMPSPVDVTIRSPSLGVKIADRFPSHGTAFRNVASPDPARSTIHKNDDDVNTQNNFKACKFKNKEKYSVSKGSSYFTRGSEEIWLVKKKDIEEIEERVLDSFRRAGGNMCLRGEAARPASEGGVFSHATLGRGKRHMYARSESLDPAWAARAHTLKRQSSVACTCGHDKKTRAKSATPAPAAASSAAADDQPPPRPRSRSHGDENTQHHVLDKYETLV